MGKTKTKEKEKEIKVEVGELLSAEKPVNTGQKQVKSKKKRKGTFVKDDPRINRDGRPEGSKNFSTVFRDFMKRIADVNGVEAGDVEDQLLRIGFVEAQKGNFSFWNNIFDRLYGRPAQPIEHSGGMEVKGAKELAEAVQALLDSERADELKLCPQCNTMKHFTGEKCENCVKADEVQKALNEKDEDNGKAKGSN